MNPIDDARNKPLEPPLDHGAALTSHTVSHGAQGADLAKSLNTAWNDVSDPASDPLVGTMIAERWKVLERINQGGMSIVYKAKHLVMDKTVAIKVLSPTLAMNATSLARFQQEAQAAGCLNHRNIITVQDVLTTPQGLACLIMDFVPGKSLSEEIAETGKFSEERAVPIFLQIANAFSEAHENGVVHRDLKPSNVMLINNKSEKDLVKVVDFGIAKVVAKDGVSSQDLTKTGDIFGSPLYMSPEQCWGRNADARSDIYSMGCLMYETISGNPPLPGGNALETIHRHINDTPEPLSDKNSPSSLKRLDAIIAKAMQKVPEQRYQTMAELERDLAMVLDGSDSSWQKKAHAAQKSKKANNKKFLPVIVILLLVPLAGSLYFGLNANKKKIAHPVMLWQTVTDRPPQEPENFVDREREFEIAGQLARQHDDPNQIAESMINAARFYGKYGKYDEAIVSLTRARSFLVQAVPAESLPVGDLYSQLATWYFMQNNLVHARESALTSIPILLKFATSRRVREVYSAAIVLSEVDLKEGKFTRDLDILDRVTKMAREQNVDDSVEYGKLLGRIADLERNAGHDFIATKLYERTRTILSQGGMTSSNDVAKCLFGMAMCAEHATRQSDAIELSKKALTTAEQSAKPDAKLIEMINDELAILSPRPGLFGANSNQ